MGEEKVFSGDASRQVTPEYYYSGGGEIHVVTDLESAIAAIDLISEQGEGRAGRIYDTEGELSHFYRYEQLKLKRYYQKGDKPHNPSGGAVKVDFNAVYPIKANAKIEDYAGSAELTNAAKAFNGYYKDFLAKINKAFNGHPHLLILAIGGMFKLKEAAQKLIKNPIPGSPGTNAAPTFQMDEVLES